MAQSLCYLNNLGIINALGSTKSEVLTHFLDNKQSTMTEYHGLFSGKPAWIAKVSSPLSSIPDGLSYLNCRNNQLIATAYDQIRNDVGNLKQQYGKNRIGVILGTSTSGIAAGETAIKQLKLNGQFPESFNYQQQEMGSCSEFLAQYAGVTGIHYTISTACSSSGKALAAADRLIKADLCDAVIVGGSDSLCELTLNGFDSLELLSRTICNPFSVNRSGLNIGEGAALFILSKNKNQIKLLGTGETSDGYHMTAPDPSGDGAKRAMIAALKAANLTPEDIGYINLHGTATKQNDKMESIAVNEIFKNKPLCSSTKPLMGHTLGAAGAQELGLCWLLLSHDDPILPPHRWDQQQDPELYELNLIATQTDLTTPRMMSNSFAFGGSNVSLIIEKES